MKNVNERTMTKWELLNKEQKEMGNEIKLLLEDEFKRVEIVQTNLGYETLERGIGVQVYENNKYDYKEVNLNYPIPASATECYQTVLFALKNKEWYREHISTPTERFIIDLIEQFECKYMVVVFDELRSRNSEDNIAINYINNIKVDFGSKTMKIEEDGEGIFMVDFKDETIEMVKSFDDEEESIEQAKKQCKQEEIEQKEKDWKMEHIRICPRCGSEMCDMKPNNAGILEESDWSCDICGWENKGITIKLIEKIIKSFNDRNYWCTLTFNKENETICIHDNEYDDNCVTELVAMDDINEIFLQDDKLFIDFDEDENGFECCEINEYGIEY